MSETKADIQTTVSRWNRHTHSAPGPPSLLVRPQIASGVFLGLYGVGLPAAVVAMVVWAAENTPELRAFKNPNSRGQPGSVRGEEASADGARGGFREQALVARVCSGGSQEGRLPGLAGASVSVRGGAAVCSASACARQEDGQCGAGLPIGRGSGAASAWANSRRQYAFNKPTLSIIRVDSSDFDLSGSCDSRSTPEIRQQQQQQQTQEHHLDSVSVDTVSTSDTSSRLKVRGIERGGGRGRGAQAHYAKDRNAFERSRGNIPGQEERQSYSSPPNPQRQVASSSRSGRPNDWAVNVASVGLSGSSSSSGGVSGSFSSDGDGVSVASDVELHVSHNGQGGIGRNGNANSIRNGGSVPCDVARVTTARNRLGGCHGHSADGISAAAVGHDRLFPVQEEIATRRPSDAAADISSRSRWRDKSNTAGTKVEGTMQTNSNASNVSGTSSQNDSCGAGIGPRGLHDKGGGWGGERDVFAADPAVQRGAICRRCVTRVWQGSGRGALWVGRKIACDAGPTQMVSTERKFSTKREYADCFARRGASSRVREDYKFCEKHRQRWSSWRQ